MNGIRVSQTDFEADRDTIYGIRHLVFVVEQCVPEEIEMDEYDPVATHVLAYIGDRAVGTGRITREGRIGRMAVLADYRGHGIGRALLEALLDIGRRQGAPRLYLSAQTQAIPFYEKFGFVAEGPVYQDAGIDHRRMEWSGPGA